VKHRGKFISLRKKASDRGQKSAKEFTNNYHKVSQNYNKLKTDTSNVLDIMSSVVIQGNKRWSLTTARFHELH
jgi:hypothetical protein